MLIGICRRVSVLVALLRNAVRLFSCLRLGIASEANQAVSAADCGFDWLIALLSALNEVETFERLLS